MAHFTPWGLGAKSALRLRVGHVSTAAGPVYASGPGGPMDAPEIGQYQRSLVSAGRGYSAPAARAVASAWRRRMVSGQRDLM